MSADVLTRSPFDFISCCACGAAFSPSFPFYILSCAHVQCETCLAKCAIDDQSARCHLCQQVTRFLALSTSFEGSLADLVHCFRPLNDLYDELRTSTSFQFSNLLLRLEAAEAKAKQQKGVLVKLAHDLKTAKGLKRRVKELEEENAGLKLALSKPRTAGRPNFRFGDGRPEQNMAGSDHRSAGSDVHAGLFSPDGMSPARAQPGMMPFSARVPSRVQSARPDLSRFAHQDRSAPLAASDEWQAGSQRRQPPIREPFFGPSGTSHDRRPGPSSERYPPNAANDRPQSRAVPSAAAVNSNAFRPSMPGRSSWTR